MTKYNTLQNDIENILKAFEGSKKTDEHEPNRGAQVLSGLTYKPDHHIFPRPDELFSLTQECNLQFHRALGLILKGEWERGLGCEKNGSSDKATQPFREVLSDAVEHTPEAINFNPDTAELFAVFQQNGNQAREAGYEVTNFDTLVQNMILAGLHIACNNGPEMARFVETETARQDMLRERSAVEQKAFWTERNRWVQAQEELDEEHAKVEKWRLMNAETKREYQSLFGRLEVELQEAVVRWLPLNLRKMLKEADPSLSEEQIAEEIAKAETFHEAKEKLQKLRHDETTFAYIIPHMAGSGTPMDVNQLKDYMAQTASLRRELYFKIHPDILKNNPNYLKLTEKQVKELDALLKQALEISPSELGFPQGFVEYDMRGIPGLLECISRVDAILESAGLDARIDAQIQGRTLPEQLEWLKRTIVSLKRRLEDAETEIDKLYYHPEIKPKRDFLACSEQHQNYRDELARETAEYRTKADQLEEELKASSEQKRE